MSVPDLALRLTPDDNKSQEVVNANFNLYHYTRIVEQQLSNYKSESLQVLAWVRQLESALKHLAAEGRIIEFRHLPGYTELEEALRRIKENLEASEPKASNQTTIVAAKQKDRKQHAAQLGFIEAMPRVLHNEHHRFRSHSVAEDHQVFHHRRHEIEEANQRMREQAHDLNERCEEWKLRHEHLQEALDELAQHIARVHAESTQHVSEQVDEATLESEVHYVHLLEVCQHGKADIQLLQQRLAAIVPLDKQMQLNLQPTYPYLQKPEFPISDNMIQLTLTPR